MSSSLSLSLFLLPSLPPSLPLSLACYLKCRCSDCDPPNQFCYGITCFAQITLNPVNGETAERLRCYNTTDICNISSTLIAFKCCDSHDLCNDEIHATLPETNNNNNNNNNDTTTTTGSSNTLTTDVCKNLTITKNCTVNETIECKNMTENIITNCTTNVTTPITSMTTPTSIVTMPTATPTVTTFTDTVTTPTGDETTPPSSVTSKPFPNQSLIFNLYLTELYSSNRQYI